MPDCLISLGSNLGDRHRLLANAARQVAGLDEVHRFRASRLFETPPIGGPRGQGAFLNGVAAFQTSLSAIEVLDRLQAIEHRLGRQRAERWDARTIDLDIVLFGERIGEGARLNVPHPRFSARLFVLIPALDIAADWCDPRSGWSIAELVHHHRHGPPSIALTGLSRELRDALCERLGQREGVHYRRMATGAAGVQVVANAPAGWKNAEPLPVAPVAADEPWVSNEIDQLNRQDILSPRVIARLRRVSPAARWPSLQDVWPNYWQWPEYVVEFENIDQAEAEIFSTLQSLACPVQPATEDARWWH